MNVFIKLYLYKNQIVMKKLIITLCLAFIGCFAFSQTADSLFNAKDYVKAVDAYKIELQAQPENVQALRRLAFCYTNIQNTGALAEMYFKKALALAPNDMASNYYLGKMYKESLANNLTPEQSKANKAQAIAYFKTAAAAGSEEAVKELESLK